MALQADTFDDDVLGDIIQLVRRVSRLELMPRFRTLDLAGVRAKSERNNPNKAVPGKKAQARAKERAEKAAVPADAE